MGFANQEGVYFNSGESACGIMGNDGGISEQWQQNQGQRFCSYPSEAGNFASSNVATAGGNQYFLHPGIPIFSTERYAQHPATLQAN